VWDDSRAQSLDALDLGWLAGLVVACQAVNDSLQSCEVRGKLGRYLTLLIVTLASSAQCLAHSRYMM